LFPLVDLGRPITIGLFPLFRTESTLAPNIAFRIYEAPMVAREKSNSRTSNWHHNDFVFVGIGRSSTIPFLPASPPPFVYSFASPSLLQRTKRIGFQVATC
jgi:hypothetical protein